MKNIKIITAVLICLVFLSGCSRRYKLQRVEMNNPSLWQYHRGDIDGTGNIENVGFDGNLNMIWKHQSNDKPVGPLTIYHNRLVYPGARNKIKFIEIKSGEFKGVIKPKGVPQTGLVVKDSLAYFAVGAKKSKVKCFNLLNRRTVWKKKVKDALSGSIIVLNKLIIGSSEGQLWALDPLSGETDWKYNCDSRLSAPPTSSGSKLFLPGDENKLFVLDAENGMELNRIELNASPVSSAAVSDAVYICDISGGLYSIDSDNGTINWQINLETPGWSSPSVDESRVYLAGSSGDVVALDKNSGVILWKYQAVDVIRSSVLVVGDYVVFGTMSGNLFCLKADDGSLVSQAEIKGAVRQSPVSDGSRIFVATEKGMITCFGDNNEEQIN